MALAFQIVNIIQIIRKCIVLSNNINEQKNITKQNTIVVKKHNHLGSTECIPSFCTGFSRVENTPKCVTVWDENINVEKFHTVNYFHGLLSCKENVSNFLTHIKEQKNLFKLNDYKHLVAVENYSQTNQDFSIKESKPFSTPKFSLIQEKPIPQNVKKTIPLRKHQLNNIDKFVLYLKNKINQTKYTLNKLSPCTKSESIKNSANVKKIPNQENTFDKYISICSEHCKRFKCRITENIRFVVKMVFVDLLVFVCTASSIIGIVKYRVSDLSKYIRNDFKIITKKIDVK